MVGWCSILNSDDTCISLPMSAESLWRENIIRNGQTALTPGEMPMGDIYIVSVNYVKISESGRTACISSTRVLCRNYKDMMNKKYYIDGLIDPSHQERRIDQPRGLAKSLTVE